MQCNHLLTVLNHSPTIDATVLFSVRRNWTILQGPRLLALTDAERRSAVNSAAALMWLVEWSSNSSLEFPLGCVQLLTFSVWRLIPRTCDTAYATARQHLSYYILLSSLSGRAPSGTDWLDQRASPEPSTIQWLAIATPHRSTV